MDILWYGLKVAVVGILVVFAGLVILIGCIKALKVVRREPENESPQDASTSVPAVAPAAPAAQVATVRTYVPGPLLTKDDDAFYAVISAAVSATLETEGVNPEGGFVIRAIKALDERMPGPAITPKDDAFYAVVTAAVAKVLEAEGVNPEGGFAIRSVKAL